MTFNRQTKVARPARVAGALPVAALGIAGPTVGTVAYATYRSPEYLTPGKYIPPTPTLTGAPAPQGQADIVVQMFLPAGPKPAGGWPVAIYGHGFTDSSYGTTFTLPSVYASAGLATVSINVVGHGGGALGTLGVALKSRRHGHGARRRPRHRSERRRQHRLDGGIECRWPAQHHQQPRCVAPDHDRSDAIDPPDRSRHRRRRRRQRRP